MDASVLETMGKIAGIGGLALGVFLHLCRDIIRRNIFPRLTRDQAYRLLRQMIGSATVVAVLGIVAWGLGASGTSLHLGDRITAECGAVNNGVVSGSAISVDCGEASDAR